MSGQMIVTAACPLLQREFDVISGADQPLKPVKKYQTDGNRQMVRCKRKLAFIAGGRESDGESAAETSGLDGGGDGGRRRTASVARRNERERRRVSLINRTFETLRDQLPASLWGHRNLAKVSKVETLRAAIGYIRTLKDLLAAGDDDDDDVEHEDEHQLAEMISSAARLASLSAADHQPAAATAAACPTTSPRTQQLSLHSSSFHAVEATASACERLECLSSGGVPTAGDIDGATRRLASLREPVQRLDSQQMFSSNSDAVADLHSVGSRDVADTVDCNPLMVDINCNYDDFRLVKSRRDDVIFQLVADSFAFNDDEFDATVGS